MPKVSVVMAVYNGLPYLNKAVESILNQTFSDFEFIIVNDASTDETLSVLQTYADPRIRIIDLPKNEGQTRSLNHGLQAAKGEYIARQDADDLSKPERLAEQVKFLDSHPDHLLLSTSVDMIDDNNRVKYVDVRPTQDAEIRTYIEEFGNPFCHGAAMFRRSVLEKVGLYREGFRTSQDYDYWLRMAEHGKVANLAPALYQYRTHSGQMSYQSYHRMQAEWTLCEELRAVRATGQSDNEAYAAGAKMLEETFRNFVPTSDQKRRIQAEIWRNKGVFELKQKYYGKALYSLMRALLYEPSNPDFWRGVRNHLPL